MARVDPEVFKVWVFVEEPREHHEFILHLKVEEISDRSAKIRASRLNSRDTLEHSSELFVLSEDRLLKALDSPRTLHA